MATTSLFFELIVIGIQGSLWLLFLFAAFAGTTYWPKLISMISNWEIIAGLFAIAGFYTLGIILDRTFHVVSDLTKLPSWLLRIKFIERRQKRHVDDDIIEIYYYAGILTSFFQYIVSRWRIARATFFNAMLLISSVIVFYYSEGRPPSVMLDHVLIGIVLFSTPLAILSLISFTTNDVAKDQRGEQIRLFFATRFGQEEIAPAGVQAHQNQLETTAVELVS